MAASFLIDTRVASGVTANHPVNWTSCKQKFGYLERYKYLIRPNYAYVLK